LLVVVEHADLLDQLGVVCRHRFRLAARSQLLARKAESRAKPIEPAFFQQFSRFEKVCAVSMASSG
jgi:hypothetical protein